MIYIVVGTAFIVLATVLWINASVHCKCFANLSYMWYTFKGGTLKIWRKIFSPAP